LELGEGGGAEDAEGGGETVGQPAFRRQDGGLSAVGDAQTRSRIDDVGIVFAAEFEELKGVARGAEGGIREVQQLLPVAGVKDLHAPAERARWRLAESQVATEVD